MASVTSLEQPRASEMQESEVKYLPLAQILLKYVVQLAEMISGTCFIEELMKMLDSDECQFIRNPEFVQGRDLAGLLIVVRHLELGSPKAFHILIEALGEVSPETARILAVCTNTDWEPKTHHIISALSELEFTLMTELSINDISGLLSWVVQVFKLPHIEANTKREVQVSAFIKLLKKELQTGHTLLWNVFLQSIRQTRPNIFQQALQHVKKQVEKLERNDLNEIVGEGANEEYKRFIENTENCRKFRSTSQVLPILDLEKITKKYGIIFHLESNPYFALIDCVIKELKCGSSQLYQEFLSAMMAIDVFFLSQSIDRCDFGSLTLQKNFAHLVKYLETTCIIKAIRPSLNDHEIDLIDAKVQAQEKKFSLIESIILRINGRNHELFDRFLEILAGFDPKMFKLLTGRDPTFQDAESCIRTEVSELKKCIKEVGHKTDKIRDIRIDLDKNYVRLRVAVKDPNTDHPMIYQATLTMGDLDIEDIMGRDENKGKLCLAKGRCGIGKTTMVQHLCRRWASDECLTQFSFLFHINVRQINLFNKQLSLHALLTRNSLYQNRLPLNWLKHWSHLLLINIDGLDEQGSFSEKLHGAREISDICEKATPDELLVNVLKRNLLPEATLICTSRPFETLSSLKSDIDLEVMGLTKEGVLEFIDKNVPFDGQLIVKSHLEANPILMSVCSITFYTSIFCRILVNEKGISSEDIDTYSRLTATLIRSYPLRQSGGYVHQSQSSKSFPALAEIALYTGNSKEDNGLTKMCFLLEENMCQIKTVDAELAIENAEKNGLVHITEVQMDDECKKILEFPHLSVQEYFAALQFLKLSNASQDGVEEKLTNLLETGTLNMYPLFIFGLAMDRYSKNMNHMKRCTIGPEPRADGTTKSITRCFASLVSKEMSSHQLLNVCQISYEAQNKQLANIVLENCQTIQTILDIEGTPLNALDIKALVFVTGSSNLQEVKLTNTNLDCYSTGILVDSLKSNQKLQVLDLSCNHVKQDGLSAISQLLEAVVGLEELSLNGNSITSSSLKKLLPGLQRERKQFAFFIAENDIGDEGATAVASALMNTKCLTALNVSQNSIGLKGMNALQDLVKKSSYLTRLECDGNAAGDELIQILFAESNDAPHLTHLSLNDSLVTNLGANILAAGIPMLNKLCFIGLRGCQIGTKGAKKIIEKVKGSDINVDLQNNQIDVNEVENIQNVQLAGNVQGKKRLRKILYDISSGKMFDILDLSNCKIKDSDTVYLSNILKNNGILVEINLSDNDVTVFSEIHLTRLAFTCPKLSKIDLSHTGFDMKRQMMFADMSVRYQMETVDLSSHTIDAIGTQCLAGVLRSETAKLRTLIANKCNFNQTDLTKICKALKENHTVMNLHLADNTFGASGASAIADLLKRNQYLTHLHLSGNNVTNKRGAIFPAVLARYSNIENMGLPEHCFASEGRYYKGGIAIADALAQNSALTYICLRDNNIGDKVGIAIGSALAINSFLTQIDLSDNVIGDEGVKAIGEALTQNTSLTQIDLSTNEIGTEGVKAIGEALAQNSCLIKIDLRSNCVGAEGGMAIGYALAKNSSLTHIDLSNTLLGDKGGKAIGGALAQNSSLTHIHLRNDYIKNKGCMAISDALARNSSLIYINLSQNEIGAKGGIAIGDALAKNSSLTGLELSYNRLHQEGGIAIGNGLGQNSALNMIDLSHNGIGVKGAMAISKALAYSTSLTTFGLSGNGIRDEGGKVIAEALAQNSSLTQINLSQNKIDDVGGKAIGEALAQNSSLTQIDLSGNGIGDDGGKAIGDALAQNSSLTHTDLSSNRIGDEGGKAIGKALALNSSLTQIDPISNHLYYEAAQVINEASTQNPPLTLFL